MNKVADVLNKDKALWIYKRMVLIRHFELRMQQLCLDKKKAGENPGALHSYEGQEAISMGISACLRDDDCVFSTHRGHGHALSKGLNLRLTVAELMGKAAGCCRGRGGSMHLFDPKIGLMGGNGIVGGGLPLVLGAGYAAKYKGTDRVAVAYFGDGGASQGSLHESMNLAGIWKLPIIYVLENNVYAATTHFRYQCPIENVAERAAGYAMPGETVPGNDLIACYQAADRAVRRARAGEGATFLEFKTYRHRTHCMVIPEHRPQAERDEWHSKDPILIFGNRMMDEGFAGEAELKKIVAEVDAELEDAVQFAKDSPYPDPATLTEGFWAN